MSHIFHKTINDDCGSKNKERGSLWKNDTFAFATAFIDSGRRGLGNIYVWASGDGGADDDCNCDGYAASMWTISINSAINDGQNAHYDESCSSTLASTFSNGAKDPNTGVVSSSFSPLSSAARIRSEPKIKDGNQ